MAEENKITWQGRELDEGEELLFKQVRSAARDWNAHYEDYLYEDDGEDLFEYGVDLTVDLDGRLRGCLITVALGGPNIYINTNTGNMEGYWGEKHVSVSLRQEAIEAIDNYVDEVMVDHVFERRQFLQECGRREAAEKMNMYQDKGRNEGR